MKYTITYSRKVRTRAYESLEVGLHAEFDETLSWDEAFNQVRAWVDRKVEQTAEELLDKSIGEKNE